MTPGSSGRIGSRWAVVGFTGIAAAVAVWATIAASGLGIPAPSLAIVDATRSLDSTFHPGVILGAGSNATDTLLAGIGVYVRDPEFTLPVLADLRNGAMGPSVENLTPLVETEFFEGGTYALGWNGSDWLVGGQATWGGINDGTLVALRGHEVTNLTALIYPYFQGGGIFALGWNGTAWLLGGNSSSGIALVGVQGTHVTDLTRYVPPRDPLGWIQLTTWNGHEWLIGGEAVFGTLQGRTYHDLLPASPYAGTGVYSGAWNGTAWLAGGGGGFAVVVEDDQVAPGPSLPAGFDQSVLFIASLSHGWVIGGKGTSAWGGIAADLVSWDGSPGGSGVADWSQLIPSAFQDGEIQGGGAAPEFGAHEFLLVGEGDYRLASGYGVGAIALLTAG